MTTPNARRLLALCACALTLAATAPLATAQDAPGEDAPATTTTTIVPPDQPLPRHRVYYKNLLAARLNPLGLEDRFELGYALRLFDDPAPLYREANLGLAFTPTLSPAVTRVGATLTVRPLTILQLAASAYWVQWFGTFEYLQTFASPNDDFSDSALERGKDDGRNYATSGFEAELQAMALARVWQIVLRSDLKFYYDDMDLRGDDTLFYNIRIDHLVPDQGWSLTNDTDLVWLSDFGLVAGLRATVTHAFYRDSDFRSDEEPTTGADTTVRLGPLLAWVIDDDLYRGFNRPTVLAVVNWWLLHPYRTGRDVSQAVPYFVLGFSFDGELWAAD